MKLAIIETGGKQYRVSPNDTIIIEKLPGKKEGDSVVFDKVLLVDDGAETKIGAPFIDGAKIEGTIEKEGRADKITVIHFKSKTRHRKKNGHRQPFMKVKIL